MAYGQWARFIAAVVLAVALLAGAPPARAHDPADDDKASPAKPSDEKKDDQKKDEQKKEDKKKDEKPKVFSHTFSGTFNGAHISYTATAGETFLKNDAGDNTASIFSVAYVKKDAGAAERRPVTFIFNGGPGSASLWLHLGVFGPKAVILPKNTEELGAAPYKVEDNASSILDVTDLVFIDPVGTGYSRALGSAKDEDYWGLEPDAKSIADFIRQWLTTNGRWNSPKYVAGESYGTTRAAQLTSVMQGDGLYLNGVMLISSILDFHFTAFQPGNDMSYIAFLPTYAAAAWYHGKVEPKPADLEGFLHDARTFAQNEYAVALLKGSNLAPADRDATIKRLAYYTGLSEDYIGQANLRINASRFMKQLLRDREKIIGRYDARIVGQDYDSAGESPEADPAFYSVDGVFAAAINDYLTRILGVNIERRYKVLEGEPIRHWKWGERGPGNFLNVAYDLGQAMRQNPDLRVFAANGLYDLATPFFATELTMAHNAIPTDRVTLKYFEAGHMMYTHSPSRAGLAREARAFIMAGPGETPVSNNSCPTISLFSSQGSALRSVRRASIYGAALSIGRNAPRARTPP